MFRYFILLFLSLLISNTVSAQGAAFGIKGGLTTAFQKWDNSDRDPLFTYNLIGSIESLPADENAFSMFAQLGYHGRGSALRIRRVSYNDPVTGAARTFGGSTTKYNFYNLVLSAGFKQGFPAAGGKLYYLLGLRGEYNLSNSFSEYKDLPENIQPLYPFEESVRDFTFGFIFGGGFELPISEYIGLSFELTLNPDYSKQYYQPEIKNIINPNGTGNSITVPERNIRNNSIELTVGFRFLRKIEYVD